MKFLVDNQLPAALARFIVQKGHDATHVLDLGMAQADDEEIWTYATSNSAAVVSKDENFLYIALRAKPPGHFLWVRLRNCRNAALLAAFDTALTAVVAAFDTGQTIVELR